MSVTPNLLLLGKVRPERKRSLNGMAAAAKMSLVAIEEPAEALTWLDGNDAACLVVDAAVPRIDKVIAKLRSIPQRMSVPVIALVQSPDELWVEQYFGWGGDDIVPYDAGASLLERLKSVPREAPKTNPARTVLIAEPETARSDALARVFAQAGFSAVVVADKVSLERLVNAQVPSVVVANSALGGLPELILELRKNRKTSGWVVLAARRELDAQLSALAPLERCTVLGLQSSPSQLLLRANEVAARLGGIERRQAPRYYVGNTVLFRAAESDEDDLGVCYNLSRSGMFIRTFAPLSADQVWIEWRIPGDKTRVRLEGEVVWRQTSMSEPARPSSPLGFGVKFGDYLGAAKTHLERALESLESGGKKSLSSLTTTSAVSVPAVPVALAIPPVQKTLVGVAAASKPVVSKVDSTARSPSVPPRPAGTVVTAPQKPENSLAVSRLPKPPDVRKVPTIGAEQLLDDGDGPTSSDETDVLKDPLYSLESLPQFEMAASPAPLETEADLLADGSMDDAPTVITKAPSETIENFTAHDDPATLPFQPPPSTKVSAPRVASVSHDTWDDAGTVAQRPKRGQWIALAIAGVVIAGGAVWYSLGNSARETKSTGGTLQTAIAKASNPVPSAANTTPTEDLSATPVPNTAGAEPVVTPDLGDELPGYPRVEEPQSGKGRLLADRYGYLIVRFPEPAFIFSENIAIGPVNSKIATTCGPKTLRIGVGEKPTTYLSDSGEVKVACRETTRVIFRRLPGVVAPPGAMRPIPISASAADGKTAESAPKRETVGEGMAADSGSTPAPSKANATTPPAEPTPTPTDVGVIDSRE